MGLLRVGTYRGGLKNILRQTGRDKLFLTISKSITGLAKIQKKETALKLYESYRRYRRGLPVL